MFKSLWYALFGHNCAYKKVRVVETRHGLNYGIKVSRDVCEYQCRICGETVVAYEGHITTSN